jgi:hypothetical protein
MNSNRTPYLAGWQELREFFDGYDLKSHREHTYRRWYKGLVLSVHVAHFPKLVLFHATRLSSGPSDTDSPVFGRELRTWISELYDLEIEFVQFDLNKAQVLSKGDCSSDALMVFYEPRSVNTLEKEEVV